MERKTDRETLAYCIGTWTSDQVDFYSGRVMMYSLMVCLGLDAEYLYRIKSKDDLIAKSTYQIADDCIAGRLDKEE